MYNVKRISEDVVTLQMLPEYCQGAAPQRLDEDEETPPDDPKKAKSEVEVPLDVVATVMRLTHAMCYFTVQGRTLRGHTVLLDTSSKNFSRRALIVGISRATHGKYVHVATQEEHDVFLGERRKVVKARRAA